MNSFYASVEMLHHLEFAGMPLAVGGDPEARHGIVLTANYIAKRKGVKTGISHTDSPHQNYSQNYTLFLHWKNGRKRSKTFQNANSVISYTEFQFDTKHH